MIKTNYLRRLPVLAFLGLLFLFYVLPLDNRVYSLGDDFAQFIQHAQNICQGRPYTQLPYPYDPEALIGPPAYPPVFPLLISPFTCGEDPNFFMIKIVSVLLFFLSLPILYRILSIFEDISLTRETLFLFSILPWMVFWGGEIVTDIPYVLFSFLSLCLFMRLPQEYPAIPQSLLTGFCMAIGTLTRDIGLSLWVSSVLFCGYKIYKYPHCRSIVIYQILGISLAFLFPVVLWKVYLQHIGLGPENSAFFKTSMGLDGLTLPMLSTRIGSNFYYYLQKFYETLFPLSYQLRQVPYLNWSRFGIAISIFSILIWQIFKAIKGPLLPIILYMACYMGVLLLLDYPMRAGVRYIIPLVSFLTYFLLKGIKELPSHFNKLASFPFYKIILLIWIGLSIWGSTYFLLQIRSPQVLNISPEAPAYQNIIRWVRKELPPDSRLVYIKPRYLSLYSHRLTAMPPVKAPPEKVFAYLKQVAVSHVLLDHNFLTEEKMLRQTIKRFPQCFSLIYNDSNFSLFLIKG